VVVYGAHLIGQTRTATEIDTTVDYTTMETRVNPEDTTGICGQLVSHQWVYHCQGRLTRLVEPLCVAFTEHPPNPSGHVSNSHSSHL